MIKILMFGTMLGVAGTALAFGGVFNHGNKSTTYKGGVDAIGVHFGGEKKTTDIPSCPEHSEWNGTACECKLGWTANESGECECPEERQCGDTCCGTGNICVDGNKCCFKNYEGNEEMCCDAAKSTGYSTEDGSCCDGSVVAYTTYSDGDYIQYTEGDTEYTLNTSCCNGVPYVSNWDDGWYEQLCCTGTYMNTSSGIVCCEEGEIYCSARNEDGSCQNGGCCDDGTVVEENGAQACAPVCEDGHAAKRILSSEEENYATDWMCCPDDTRLYCDIWKGGDSPWCPELKCCPENKELHTYEFASTCCEPNETPYCFERSWAHNCRKAGCCATEPTMFDTVSACCNEGEIPYCASTEFTTEEKGNSCSRAGCCQGTVSYGTGYAGADVCNGTGVVFDG